MIRYRVPLLLLWGLLCALLLPLAGKVESRLVPAGRIPGSESDSVETLLANRFGSPYARYAILVVTGISTGEPARRAAVLTRVTRGLDSLDVVSRVYSVLNTPDSILIGNDGKSAIVVAGLDAHGMPVDSLVNRLRGKSLAIAGELRLSEPAIVLRWTGEDALNLDVREANSDDIRRSERRALPLTLVLLLITFGGVVAALIPILLGVLAIPLVLGLGAVLATRIDVSVLFQSTVSILGLALGIDYALLLLSRFREATSEGLGAKDAAALSARQAGRTILLSGAAVAVGLASLLTVRDVEERSVGLGGLMITMTCVLLATTVLPGILSWIGPIVSRPRWKVAGFLEGQSFWKRWGEIVTRHPRVLLVVSLVPMVALGWQARRMHNALPADDWLPAHSESALALRDLRAMGRSAALQNVRVVVQLPRGVSALSPAGLEASASLSKFLAGDSRVARVRSLSTLAAGQPRALMRALLPDSVQKVFVSADSSMLLVEATPAERVGPSEVSQLVRDIRAGDPAKLTGVRGAVIRVGGLPAFNADFEDVQGAGTPRVVALVLAGTFMALFIAFSSVMIAAKAVAMNLLTVAATFGAVVLVFQDGFGGSLLGLDGPLGSVFPSLPVIVFATVFGISMDYEVFLIARVAEARRTMATDREAIASALAKTGKVITSAAAIMVVIFGAFATGDSLPVRMLGFALAVAVLLDATLVRLVIGPSILQLAGKWNWWPGKRY